MPYNATPNLPAGQLYNNGAVRFDTRQIANMMYQEQRMRQMEQQRQAASVEKQLQDEIGKVRSADTQAIVDDYNNYKNLRSQLYNKKNQRDPVKYQELQRMSDLAYRNLMGGINASIEYKGTEDSRKKAFMTNPDLFADDFGDRMAASLRTPTRAMNKVMYNGKEHDFTSEDTFRYNGANFNLGEIDQKAEGQLKPTGYADRKEIDKFSHRETPYQFGSTPAAYKDYYMSALHERKAGRAASAAWDQLPKEEFDKTLQEFKSIAPDKWQKMGITAQDLKSSNPENKAENWATYRAMRYAIDKNPVTGTPTTVEHTEEKMKQQFANQKELAKLNHGLREDEIRLHNSLKTADDKTKDAGIDKWIKGIEDDAFAKNKPLNITRPNGETIHTYKVEMTTGIRKAFERIDKYGNKVYPDELGVDKKGTYYPMYYKKNIQIDKKSGKPVFVGDGYARDKDGKKKLDDMLSAPVHRDALKPDIANVYLSPKLVAKSMDDQSPASDFTPTSPSASYEDF